jgi:hypothetical protein
MHAGSEPGDASTLLCDVAIITNTNWDQKNFPGQVVTQWNVLIDRLSLQTLCLNVMITDL